MVPRTMKLIFLAAMILLTVSVFAAPYTVPYGSFLGLDGNPGFIDHSDLWNAQNAFTGTVYTIGDIICHQEQARVFILNGSEMPVCVRDVGILFGLILGTLISLKFEGSSFLERYSIRIFIIGFGLMLLDWGIQHIFTLNVPVTRILTGIVAGVTVSILIFYWVDGRFYGTRSERQGQRP